MGMEEIEKRRIENMKKLLEIVTLVVNDEPAEYFNHDEENVYQESILLKASLEDYLK